MESPVPFKKRKVLQSRRQEGVHTNPSASLDGDLDSARDVPRHDTQDDPAPPTRPTDLTKSRTNSSFRRGGVGFSSNGASRLEQGSSSELVRHQPENTAVNLAANRFVSATGQAVAVDTKHMAAYIDSRLASLAQTSIESPPRQTGPAAQSASDPTSSEAARLNGSRYHGTQIQVEEVDLPTAPAAKPARPDIQRIPINKPGRRRRERPMPPPQPAPSSDPTKPSTPSVTEPTKQSTFVPRRKRHVRTEEDIARDALVEQFLSENRLENVYTSPSAPSGPATDATHDDGAAPAGHDREADIRLADQFRREFLAEAEERRQLKRTRQPAAANAKSGPDELKGPKLGGSRQQRAAMHASLQGGDKKARKPAGGRT